jgi:hypothetical protein
VVRPRGAHAPVVIGERDQCVDVTAGERGGDRIDVVPGGEQLARQLAVDGALAPRRHLVDGPAERGQPGRRRGTGGGVGPRRQGTEVCSGGDRRWTTAGHRLPPAARRFEAHVRRLFAEHLTTLQARPVRVQQPKADDLAGERVVDLGHLPPLGVAEHRRVHRAAGPVEEPADLAAQVVHGHTDPHHAAVAVDGRVHPRHAWQACRVPQLGRPPMPGQRGQRLQVVERGGPERPRPLDEEVEQLDRGRRVLERPVAGHIREPEPGGERAEPTVVGLVAQQGAGEVHRVDDGRRIEQRPVGPGERGVEETHVERDVVTRDHRVARELDQRRQHGVDRGQPDPGGGTDQGVQGAELLAAAHQQRAHLGDLVPAGIGAGGLEVEHAEGDLVERLHEPQHSTN